MVDNAPKVKPDRLAKLENVLTRVFSKFGNVLNQFHPMDENELSKGSVYLSYALGHMLSLVWPGPYQAIVLDGCCPELSFTKSMYSLWTNVHFLIVFHIFGIFT